MEGLEIVGTVSVEGNSLVLTGDMVPAVTICWTLQEDQIVQTSKLRYSLGSAGLC